MTAKGDEHDPKGLIFEAYRIDGITKSECRTIFLDWALSLPGTRTDTASVRHLLDRYGAEHVAHPMTEVLRQAIEQAPEPRRRGGWRSRDRPV